MAESQATHKLHDINDLAVYVMQSSEGSPQLRLLQLLTKNGRDASLLSA
jgi:hypothetical protein